MTLAEFLAESGLTLGSFAETVGVSEASMGRYAAGKRIPRPAIMRRIVAASGGRVQPNDFFADLPAPAAPADAVSDASSGLDPDAVAVDMLLCDMCGLLRGKRLAPGGWGKLCAGGVVMPGSTFALDVTGANVDATGTGMPDGDPDGVCRPVAATLAPVPWAEAPRAQVLASMYGRDGAPFTLDPRHVLARVVERFRPLGLTPVVALELEFYLVDREPAGDGGPQPPRSPLSGRRPADVQVYGMDDLDAAAAVIDGVAAACRAQAIPAEGAIAEYAPGQYEINLRHQPDALAAADHAVLLKRAVKGVARRHGLDATFMAKPYAEDAGNGLHIHVSLVDAAGGNAFDERAPGGEARLGHAIGGLARTMGEAMAIFAPNANSYRRFVPGAYAPLAPSWGHDNRTVAIRVPAAGGRARRLEHRCAGADANPYLATAAVLAGVHHGLVNALDPGPPVAGNAYAQVAPSLPATWLDALGAFAAAAVIPDYLGAGYCRVYAAARRDERDRFAARVTPTEHAWYLPL